MQVLARMSVFGASGYDNTNLLYVCGLIENGVNVKLLEFPHNYEWHLQFMDNKKANLLRQAINQPQANEFIYFNRTVWDCLRPYLNAKKTIASTVWECLPFPTHVVNSMNLNKDVDLIVVPSTFNQKSLQPAVNKPVALAREGIDIDIYNQIPINKPVDDTFNFLSIFQWLPRKGYDILLESFFHAFSEHDNVSLIIKTSSLNYEVVPSSAILQYVKQVKNRHRKNLPVYILPIHTPYNEILDLYKKSHIYVCASRAEGFCRPLLEAMAGGLPTITTGWGGQTDFCTPDTSYLIDYQLTPVSPQWYCGDFQPYQQWAEPSIEHLVYLMRRVYENYSEAKQKAVIARDLSKAYDYREVAKDLIKLFG